MAGLISIYTSVGILAVMALVLVWIVLYWWYLRHKNVRFAEELDLYSSELEAILKNGSGPVPQDFFSTKVSRRRNLRLLREYLHCHCTVRVHPQIARIRQYVADIGLTDALRMEARNYGRWSGAAALRMLAALCNPEDADIFRRAIRESKFRPAIIAAAIGLADSGVEVDPSEFLPSLYNAKHPNRDEVLSVLSRCCRKSAVKCRSILADQSLQLPLRAAVADFIGVMRDKEAAPELERMLETAQDDEFRLHLIEALEKAGNGGSCRIILPFLKSSDFRVRLKAVNALERLAGGKYLAEAEELLSDGNLFVRRNAAESISRMGEAGVKKLLEKTASSNRDIAVISRIVLVEKKYDRIRWRFRYGDSIA